METKICFKCLDDKPLSDFYIHKGMKDGHLGKCKYCTIKDSKIQCEIKVSTPEGLEKERARHRDKYHRLDYKEKHKPTPEKKKEIMSRHKAKYPEKYKAKNISSHLRPVIEGNHLHHWNYDIPFAKDVIELSVENHNKAHRFLEYDKELFFYKDSIGNLLDTKEKHIAFLKAKGIQLIA
jgi:hypothetical protein